MLNIELENMLTNLFAPRKSWFRFLKWPRVFGILPLRLLTATVNTLREDKFPNENGMFPIKLLT